MNFCQKVTCRTPTGFWINNPTLEEIGLSVSEGISNCTTNPAYCAALIKNEPGYLREVTDSVIAGEKNDDIAADLIYQKAVGRIMDRFAGIGYVTAQPDPRQDTDADLIVAAVDRHRKLGPNYMAKIPVTAAGAKAIETVLKKGVPVCATEVFSVSQALYVCELHKRACEETGKHVPMYVTHITGIFDEYLTRYARLHNIEISPELLNRAGAAAGRKQYHALKNRGYKVRMLGGGARGTRHFTEFLGGAMDVTVNWGTFAELRAITGEPENRIDAETPGEAVAELCSKFEDFGKAYEDNGLAPEEFEDFPPVRLFRNNFLEGYYRLLAEISARRALCLC